MFKSLLTLFAIFAVSTSYPQNSFDQILRAFNPDYGKIVGGTEVEPNSIPHQVSFQLKSGSHICGGSIINEGTILTAGHCCAAVGASLIRIVAGEHDLSMNSGHEQFASVSKIQIHPGYGINGFDNDVCILKLSEKLTFNDKVSPVTLPEEEQEFTGDATVSGWGTTAELGPSSNVLLSVDVKIVSPEECKKSYPQIDETMICAAAPGKDACQGDSGGPMTCDEEKLHCGVVSFGKGCARPGYPGVYGRTSHFIDWINKLA